MLTPKSGMSIALVTVIIGGIVANMSMMFALRNDVALVQKDVTHVVEDTKEIRSAMAKLGEETTRDTIALRIEISTMRTQIAELSSRLNGLER